MIRAFLARVEEDHDVGEAGRDGLRNLSTVDVDVVVEANRGVVSRCGRESTATF